MTEEMTALARRVVACRGWRWMPGMLFVRGNGTRIRLVVELGTHAIGVVQGGGHPSWREPLPMVGVLPDLTDAATLGCFLALVREAHGRHCYTQACGGYWTVQREDTEHAWGDHCDTEAEALVAALEAAP